jgi:hypothetical protein
VDFVRCCHKKNAAAEELPQ